VHKTRRALLLILIQLLGKGEILHLMVMEEGEVIDKEEK